MVIPSPRQKVYFAFNYKDTDNVFRDDKTIFLDAKSGL